jgi:uncharacterized membrane protein
VTKFMNKVFYKYVISSEGIEIANSTTHFNIKTFWLKINLGHNVT